MRDVLIAVIVCCTLLPLQASALIAKSSQSAKAAPQRGQVTRSVQGAVLEGTVADSSGALLVDAKVTVTGTSGKPRSVITDAQGKFVIRDLEDGSYTVLVEAHGFAPSKTEYFNIKVGEPNYIESLLHPASEISRVEVTAESRNQIETETAELAGTITEHEIKSVPDNGRTISKFINLTPGVTDQTGQDEAKVGVLGSAKYSVNGGRVEYNTWDVDGTDIMNPDIAASRGHSTFIVYPSVDAVEEMKVLTSNYGAQYGRSASGTIVVSTKSGGQTYHGSAYEYLRNEALNARGFNDPVGSAPVYRRNDFGYTLGGPIFIPNVYNTRKDKSYFFFSQEFRLERSPVYPPFNQAVPSMLEREGNFSDVCPPAAGTSQVDPSKYPDCPKKVADQFPYQTYDNNIVPIDQNARAVLESNIIPIANAKSGCNTGVNASAITDDPATWPCYNVSTSPNTYWREELVRLDHNFRPSVKGSFRYVHDEWNTTVATPQWQYTGTGPLQNSFPTVLNNFVGPGFSLVGHLTLIHGSSFVNDIAAGATEQKITLSNMAGPGVSSLDRPAQLGATCGTSLSSCGMGYLFPTSNTKLPGIRIAGSNAAYGGNGFLADTSYMPWSFSNPTINFRDDLSMVFGKHTMHVGVLTVYARHVEVSSATGANTGDQQGLLTFSNVSNPWTTGNAFADFLYGGQGHSEGKIQYFQQDSAQPSYKHSYWTIEPYVQDDWHVRPNLIIDWGLRVSLFGNWTPNGGAPVYNFVPGKFDSSLASAIQVNPTYGYLQSSTNVPVLISTTSPDAHTTNGLVQCGVNGVPSSCMSSHIINPGPRIGFAWDVGGNGKTSIRGGYGLFFEHGTGVEANSASLIGSAPGVLSMTQDGVNTSNGLNWECIGGRGIGCSASGGLTMPVGAAYPIDITAIPTKAVWPYVQQWSLSIQREMRKNLIATAAYVGSKGTHLTTVRQLNQLSPVAANDNYFGPHEPIYTGTITDHGVCWGFQGSGNTTDLNAYIVANGHIYYPGDTGYLNIKVACSQVNPNALRKYNGYGRIFSIENLANSTYNAMQFTLRYATKDFSGSLNYTYAHSIDEASDRYSAALGNSLDSASNRASSDFDQRQNFNISFLRTLPLLSWYSTVHEWGCMEDPTSPGTDPCVNKNPYPGPPSWVRMLLENWQFSTVAALQNGTPFSIVNGGSSQVSVLDNAGVANGLGAGSYPDIMRGASCGASKPSGVGPLLGFPCKFVAPRGLTFGNAGRNFMHNPKFMNADLGLIRQFAMTEQRHLEFRVEAFNLFNLAEYRIYNPEKGNTAANTITCYGDASTGYSAGAASCAANSGFLRPVDAHRPRTMQLALRMDF